MGRPAKHTEDDYLDAAIEIFSRDGIRAVTLAAVAQAVGAANGSIYHRFPTRSSLLEAVWRRTSQRFEAAYRDKLGEPSTQSLIAAAVWIVDWCIEERADAQVLQAGQRVFCAESDTVAELRGDRDRDIHQAARSVVSALSGTTNATPDQIAFVMLDLPVAVVRRKLQRGEAPGSRERELVRGIAQRLLE